MIKFVYIVSLTFASFLLFIFSKEREVIVCNDKATGKIELIKDSSRSYLGVITEDHRILYPTSMNEDMVLAAGQKVTICYAIDSSAFVSKDAPIPVHIETISYLSH
ncbi:MAG: hypothetical protein QM802_08910 [Agriterribacter sp.]